MHYVTFRLQTAYCILHIESCILNPAYCILHIASCILHPAYCILHIASCILHPAYFILHIASCILHPAYLTFENSLWTDRPTDQRTLSWIELLSQLKIRSDCNWDRLQIGQIVSRSDCKCIYGSPLPGREKHSKNVLIFFQGWENVIYQWNAYYAGKTIALGTMCWATSKSFLIFYFDFSH